MNIQVRKLALEEISLPLFASFQRHQTVKRCWRKDEGSWILKDIAFEENWGPKEKEILVRDLANTTNTGGDVWGAFQQNRLIGFCSVEKGLFGNNGQYAELTSIHVSEESRGMGTGRLLFEKAKTSARSFGAKKLYISGHSSEESQAFYKAMGCREAEEYSQKVVEKEPFDCQLECPLEDTP